MALEPQADGSQEVTKAEGWWWEDQRQTEEVLSNKQHHIKKKFGFVEMKNVILSVVMIKLLGH